MICELILCVRVCVVAIARNTVKVGLHDSRDPLSFLWKRLSQQNKKCMAKQQDEADECKTIFGGG